MVNILNSEKKEGKKKKQKPETIHHAIYLQTKVKKVHAAFELTKHA